ncbi:alpha/beta hydrolase [Pseudoalteromonas sp. DL2-H2.2]|uniref:alpha/beta hydrolase n=1 Tax=Pseudoalteromonas TaxID=53246 RepID=UPI0005FA4AE7|nr:MULTISPECIES: alpha/beta fold hydrolase [Pseudoalteromonas]MCF2909100.1 alpha/beta hydrolase [Pseudoalteromonas sp. DL2-H2.2]
MSSNTEQLGKAGILFSRAFMRVMFASVQGWKNNVSGDVEQFQMVGLDGSNLEVSLQHSTSSEVKGVLLLCHPFLKYGLHYFHKNEMSQAFCDAGYHVLCFNFKGFGRSNIKGHAFWQDVLSVANMAQQRFGGLPIHLLGCSFGGFHLTHALAEDKSPFSSVVLDSVPPSVTVFFKGGLIAKAMRWISNSRLSTATGTRPIVHSLKQVKGLPIVFFYGDADEYMPHEDVRELKVQCPEVSFVKFANCGHLEIYKLNKQEYVDAVTSFFCHGKLSDEGKR